MRIFLRASMSVFCLIISFFAIEMKSQRVTPWLTTGSKSSLLQAQTPVSFVALPASAIVSVSIDSLSTYQTMDGFGFCLTEGSAEVISSMTSTQQDALMNELFGQSGIGLSVIRVSIGASDLSSADYCYNESSGDVTMSKFSLEGLDKLYLIPILKKALTINPDLKILATPWTAPKWMKTNLAWVGGSLNTLYYTAYANYFVKYFDAMQAEGINIWAITPQNEPLNQGNDPSMGMTSSEQITFINSYLGPAMKNAGYSNIKIIAYDHNCDNTTYPIDVCNKSSYVDGAAFHLYAGDISAMTTVKNATNKNVYFTEQYTASAGSFSGDFGWHMQNVMIGASINWGRAVIEWNLASNPSVGPHTPGGCSTCLGAITVNSSSSITRNVSYYIVGQLSKFVKPGAKRLYATSSSSSVKIVAFKNSDGSSVLVAYNANSSSQTMLVSNGSTGFNYTIPATSAITFVWNNLTSRVEEVTARGLILSPNPVLNRLSVRSEVPMLGCFIYDINGKQLLQKNFSGDGTTEIIDVSSLPRGAYFFKAESEGLPVVRRFIKI